jgi:hypothetical protein
MTTLMYDPETKQVGCVLIQAACGCNHSLVHKYGFDTRTWFLAPTEGMKRLSATDEQWRYVAELSNEHWSVK